MVCIYTAPTAHRSHTQVVTNRLVQVHSALHGMALGGTVLDGTALDGTALDGTALASMALDDTALVGNYQLRIHRSV